MITRSGHSESPGDAADTQIPEPAFLKAEPWVLCFTHHAGAWYLRLVGDSAVPFLPAHPENYLVMSLKPNNLIEIHLELFLCQIFG